MRMYEDILARVPLFADLPRRELKRIGETCVARECPAGVDLVREGDSGVRLFIIREGRARVVHRHIDGSEHELAALGPGEVFGEMALLDEQARSATVTALEPTSVLVLNFWDFRAMLLESPEIAIKLLTVLSRRLRAAEQRERHL
jgi:CRP/FNR family transcriptional regulator